jgi:hypothetical protein
MGAGGAKEFHVAQRFDPDLKKQFDATINWERNLDPYLRIESAQTDVWGQVRERVVRSLQSCEYYIDGPEAPSPNGELLSHQSPRIITSFRSVTKSERMFGVRL